MSAGPLPRPADVLFVEDDPGIVALLETLVSPLGARLRAVDDLGPAMALLDGPAPDLVLLDLVLPSGEGMDFLRALRAHAVWRDTPVLVLTARPASRHRATAFDLGADDYVEKPFDLDTIEGKIRSLLRLSLRAREAERQRELFGEVVDRLPSGLMVLDAETHILYLNPNGADILGLDAASAVGRSLDEALPTLSGSLQSSADQREVRVRVGGEERLIGYTVAPLGGHGTVVVFRDLATIERLRRAEGGAARLVHEIRNPLTAVRAALTLIAARELPVDRRGRLASAAADEAARVASLAEEYLAQRRVRRPAREGVSLAPLLHEIVELNLLGVPAPPRVAVTAGDDLPGVRGDRARLRQIVLNLLLNAIEATRGGGGLIEIRAVVEGAGVVVEVADNGPGIPEDVLPRIFDERFTTRPTGDGLGLAIVRQIVDEEGGWIDVRSAVGAGATFRVWLPIAVEI